MIKSKEQLTIISEKDILILNTYILIFLFLFIDQSKMINVERMAFNIRYFSRSIYMRKILIDEKVFKIELDI
jgi:hypothetical protein